MSKMSKELQAATEVRKPDRGATPRVILNAKFLAAAATVASTNVKRRHINAVNVEVSNSSTYYVGTNGVSMVVLNDDAYPPEEYEKPFQFLIPLHIIALLRNLLLTKRGHDDGIFGSHVMVQRMDGGDLVFTSIAGGNSSKLGTVVCREAEVFFPNWRSPVKHAQALGGPLPQVQTDWAQCMKVEHAYHAAGGVGYLPMHMGDAEDMVVFSAKIGDFCGIVSATHIEVDEDADHDDDAA